MAGNRDEEEHNDIGATLGAQYYDSQSSPQYTYHHHNFHNYDRSHNNPSYQPQNPHPTPILIHTDAYPTALDQHRPLSPAQFSHAGNNLQAFNANATSLLPVDVDATEPDDFYRNYRGIDTSVTAPSGHGELMASAIPTPRQTHNASLRSNGNGTTPRHPTIPSARTGLRPSARSVSAPIDGKTSPTGAKSRPIAYGTSQKPSVKDLKKRFDQHAAQPTSSTTVRKTVPRISTRETSSPGASKGAGNPTSPTNAQPSYASLRSSVTRGFDSGTASSLRRPTQRNKSVNEDQVSNNSQSFASRIGKPRTSPTIQVSASKSMVSLSQPSSPTSIPSAAPQSRGLLFGEILPTDSNSRTAGYGIEGVRARRTSESNLQNPGLRLRSLSHPDAEPSSPSDWYRSAADGSRGVHGYTDANDSSRPRRTRNRSHSDLAGSKPSPQLRITPISRPHPTPANPASEATPSSKLPVAVWKLNSPVDSPSPSSTRSNSPSAYRRPAVQEKLAKPTNPPRAKTPTNIPASRRGNRPGTITPNGNARLNAYISTPPPKLSPPLRSSRPRQPVSSATTTSSRMKVNDRERADNKSTLKPGEHSTRRRKISMGPIDFESRREQIKLSYTRSIRENEARAAARRAEEERKRKAEAEARAARAARAAERERQERERQEQERQDKERLEQEIKEREQLEKERLEKEHLEKDCLEKECLERERLEGERLEGERLEGERLEEERRARESEEVFVRGDSHALDSAETPTMEQPVLTITTSVAQPCQTDVLPQEMIKMNTDSPTLGIPGSFPALAVTEDETPLSAISNTTEFDVEPQTEPPLPEASPPLPEASPPLPEVSPPLPEVSPQEDAAIASRQNEKQQSTYLASVYRSPFDEDLLSDDGASIKISLDAPPETNALYINPSTTEDASNVDPAGSRGQEDDEYEPKPFETPPTQTTVTIIGRNSDFQPRDHERDEVAVSTRLLNVGGQDDTDIQSEHSDTQLKLSYNADAFLNDDQSAEFARRDGYFIGPSVQDSVARMRDSTGDPSELGNDSATTELDSSQGAYSNVDARTTTDMPQSLTIPRTTDLKNRISQTTVWTDYSIDSQNAYSLYGAHERNLQQRDSSFRESTSVSELGSRSQSIQYDRDSGDYPSSPDISPRGTYQDLELSFDKDHQLPEVDTGDSFGIEYITRKSSTSVSSVPVIPDHEPPPPPDVVSFPDASSSAPPSEYFDDTRPSSYMRTSKDDRSVFSMDPSLRESEDFAQSESAPQSIDQTSADLAEGLPVRSVLPDGRQSLAESADKTEDDHALPPQERKRLFTRLETIKELIDTEAFFIRDMNIVEEIYKGTAEACPKLDDTTIKLIFRNTDQIIAFHSSFLAELKEGVASVYTPKTHRNVPKETSTPSDSSTPQSLSSKAGSGQLNDDNDRLTSLGPIFTRNIEKMKAVHESFLKNSDYAAKRLIQIQEDPTVKVWLNECNEVARDLTKAWNLDSLLIKPMQRITKYPNLIIQLLHETPQDHPDRPQLESAKCSLENAIVDINKTKKNFELVGQIVGRKRKESDVKANFARAFGKRVDKLQTASNRPPEDPEYLKFHERFGDDYLRLQVVLRDVEFYTRQVTAYVHEFLQYLSSMELVMRLQPSPHPEIESKWVRFNVSMRDVEKVALEQHLSQVRKQVIEPFEQVIKSYGNPSLAMKKRSKRRLDYEKFVQLKKNGKKIDKQLAELVEQYEALNEALKKELPKLSSLTEKVGNICLGNFVNIQTQWFAIWKEKVKVVLDDQQIPETADIINTFQRDYKFQEEQINSIGIINPASIGRPSQSASTEDSASKLRPRPAELSSLSSRGRGLSINSDVAPTLPTPDFMRRNSGQLTISPSATSIPSPHQYYYRDYYSGINSHSRPGSGSPMASEFSLGTRSLAAPSVRPGTGQSYESGAMTRQSLDSGAHARHHSNSANPSPYQATENQRFSGLFQSALPLSDTPERQPRPPQASSRGSSRDRNPINGYNVLWLAASLFEFNIETTKHEAGYPYLTYQAGEIFDVIAEKGELWLAKNQDDPKNLVGWLWSKHFAKLADD